MPSHSGLITIIDRACRKAGAKLRRDFYEVQQLQVSKKGPADFVTKADQQSERTLYEELGKARPDWGFLMEEGGDIPGNPDKPRFIVDPLDGTTNFLHGIPHFAISVAVEEEMANGKREITSAMIYQPITDEVFWAERGRGAWVQENRLRVSARRHLDECLIATGIPFLGHGDFAQWTRIFGAVAPEVAGIRRFGAASLDLAWVAAGRFDGFWESGLQPWDVAAGILMIREAGGFVTDFRGGDRVIERQEVIAGNDATHSKLQKLAANALR
jgi:myo-inositol-1(or 4)-monophosphatase